MKRLGLLVNPIAGLGGAVGLKGTDGDAFDEAVRRGAFPKAPFKAIRALKVLDSMVRPVYVTAEGMMGEEELLRFNLKVEELEVATVPPSQTSTEHTIELSNEFLSRGVDLVLFAGGDGTARDICSVIGDRIPVIGIPAGVKMHSSVFATDPEHAGEVAGRYLTEELPTKEGEVMDVDEELFRRGEMSVKLYGTMRVPNIAGAIQCTKCMMTGPGEEGAKLGIAEHIADDLREGLWIVGPGSTTKAVTDQLGEGKTLLGIDVYLNGKLVASDVSEGEILKLLDDHGGVHARVLVTPIGAQGYILGRGNQPLSSKVVKAIGKENLIVVATPQKLRETEALRVDTGDRKLDEELRGYVKVVTGEGEYKMREVK